MLLVVAQQKQYYLVGILMARNGRPNGCNGCGCQTVTPPPPPPDPPLPPLPPEIEDCFSPSSIYYLGVSWENSIFALANKPLMYTIKPRKALGPVGAAAQSAMISNGAFMSYSSAGSEYLAESCDGYGFTSSPCSWGKMCNFGLAPAVMNNNITVQKCYPCNGADTIPEDSTANFATLYTCIPPSDSPSSASWWGVDGEFLPPCVYSRPTNQGTEWYGMCRPGGLIKSLSLLSTGTVVEPDWNIPFFKWNVYKDKISGPFPTFFPDARCGWFKIYKNTDDNRYIIISGGPPLKPLVYQYNNQPDIGMSFGASITSTDRDLSSFFNSLQAAHPYAAEECTRELDPASWCTSRSVARTIRRKVTSTSYAPRVGRISQYGEKRFDEWPLSPPRSGTIGLSFSHWGGNMTNNCRYVNSINSIESIIDYYKNKTDWDLSSLDFAKNCDRCPEAIRITDTMSGGGVITMQARAMDAFWPFFVVENFGEGLVAPSLLGPLGLNPNYTIEGLNDTATSGNISEIGCAMKW
jgi:hypothetical protein